MNLITPFFLQQPRAGSHYTICGFYRIVIRFSSPEWWLGTGAQVPGNPSQWQESAPAPTNHPVKHPQPPPEPRVSQHTCTHNAQFKCMCSQHHGHGLFLRSGHGGRSVDGATDRSSKWQTDPARPHGRILVTHAARTCSMISNDAKNDLSPTSCHGSDYNDHEVVFRFRNLGTGRITDSWLMRSSRPTTGDDCSHG